jgi:hypothetical protein
MRIRSFCISKNTVAYPGNGYNMHLSTNFDKNHPMQEKLQNATIVSTRKEKPMVLQSSDNSGRTRKNGRNL